MKSPLALLCLLLAPVTSLAQSAVVNLNAADAVTLARELDGIGESKARAIVEYRQKNGPFRRVEDLALAQGIGTRTLEMNRSRLRVDGQGTAAPRALRPAGGAASPQAAPRAPTNGAARTVR